MKIRFLLSGIASLALLIAACGKDSDSPVSSVPTSSNVVYIINEGNFQRNNSELSVFLPDSGIVYNNVFKSVNGVELGDVGNSMIERNGKVYLVINGSNKIEVIDAATRVRTSTIQCQAGGSPRYVAFDSKGRMFVSNLYRNSVSQFNETDGSLVREISVGMNPEQILADGTTLYVANSGFGTGRSLSVINTETGTVKKDIPVSDNPVYLSRLDATHALLLCVGAYNDFNDPNDDTPGRLYTIDLSREIVSDSITISGHPQRVAIDGKGNAYTVGGTGIMRIALTTHAVETEFIPGYFYSIAFDSARSRFYITDPLDYLQPGKLYVYSLQGTRISEHTIGIIPGTIWVE
jgi:YVTN family beta-propeller protein